MVRQKSGPGYRRIAAAAAQPTAAGAMVETAVLTVREDSNNALARAQDRQGAAGGGEVTTSEPRQGGDRG